VDRPAQLLDGEIGVRTDLRCAQFGDARLSAAARELAAG
jgi:hypothetical protein